MSSARFGRRSGERRRASWPAVPNLDQGVAMLSHTARLAAPAALALLVGGLACSDHTPGTGPEPGNRAGSPGAAPPAAPAPPEQLARGLALALGDPDVPVAFDVHGNRRLLDPERPPATPVIAVVPVETDFSTKPSPLIACLEYCGGDGGGGGGGSPPPPSPGLYMTKAHFVDD